MNCSDLPGCREGEDLLFYFQTFFTSSNRKLVRPYGRVWAICQTTVWWPSKELSQQTLNDIRSWISLVETKKWASHTTLGDVHFCLMQLFCEATCSYCSPLKQIFLTNFLLQNTIQKPSDLLGYIIKNACISSVNCSKFCWNVRVSSHKTVFAMTVPQPQQNLP